MQTYSYTYTYTCMHAGRQAYIHTCIHIYIHIYVRIYLSIYLYIYIYLHTYIHIVSLVVGERRPGMTEAFLKMALASSCEPELRKQEEDGCNSNPMYMPEVLKNLPSSKLAWKLTDGPI